MPNTGACCSSGRASPARSRSSARATMASATSTCISRGGTAPAWKDLLRGCAPLLIALSRRHRELRCPAEPACTGAESWASGFSLRDPGGRPVAARPYRQAGGARAGLVASHRGDLQEPHLQEMPGRQPEGIPAEDAVASGTGTDRPFLLSRDGRPGAPGRWRPQRGDGETARRSARWHQRSTRQVDSIIRSSTNRNGKPVATEAACRG